MRASSVNTEYQSALAQLVEQMTVNHWVAGSSPASGAKYKKAVTRDGLFCFKGRQHPTLHGQTLATTARLLPALNLNPLYCFHPRVNLRTEMASRYVQQY